ncbi:MAG: glycosyltransferase family 4 protein [Verrucomicrobiota bacterium]
MKFLLLNQTFHPDVVATAQVLKDLALALAERGHEVTVLCGRRAYDTTGKTFSKRERWNNIEIHRVGSLGLGKAAKWKRAADFASFFLTATFKALRLPKQDVVIALTSPPLISALGALLARRWRARFIYWVMDLNPDEAIAAGWLKTGSLAAKILDGISKYSLHRAERVVVLDRFMEERILAKGIPREKIAVIPPWSHDDEVRFDPIGREQFRKAHGLDGKFVVMYSGNHSPCHPLDTLLEAARRMGSTGAPPVPFGDPPKDISESILPPQSSVPTGDSRETRESTGGMPALPVFCFVGGGSEWRKIKNQKSGVRNPNILCLPYQPLQDLSGSLSAADLHVVVMGEKFLGTIHPCKIYNILLIGSPVLFIGPQPSHVSEILKTMDESCYGIASHGDTAGVVAQIKRFQKIQKPGRDIFLFESTATRFSKRIILPKLVTILETKLEDSLSPPPP